MGIRKINEYVILKPLGVGSSATVVHVLKPDPDGNDANDLNFAMKIISRHKLNNQSSYASSLAEFEVLKRLSHVNIV
jgi:5'-AMP-activated protein kinase, catalytic alpha subunit